MTKSFSTATLKPYKMQHNELALNTEIRKSLNTVYQIQFITVRVTAAAHLSYNSFIIVIVSIPHTSHYRFCLYTHAQDIPHANPANTVLVTNPNILQTISLTEQTI